MSTDETKEESKGAQAPPAQTEVAAAALKLRQEGRNQEAIAMLQRALQLAPEEPEIHYQLGKSFYHVGRVKDAMRCFREVLNLKPDHLMAATGMADLFREAGFLDQAASLFARIVQQTPDDPDTCVRLADTLCELGQLEPAMGFYDRALDLDPDHIEALVGRAGLLSGQQRLSQAESSYQRALQLQPDHIDALIGLGSLYRKFIPLWHFPMLNDTDRNDAFERAIQRAVAPGQLVLDVGCGTGLLSMMAVRAGAEKVVAVEAVGPIARAAEEIIAHHGYADKIQVVHAHSTLLRVGEHLERRADLLIAEVLDTALIGEGILPVVRHARAHLLTDNARIIPKRAVLVAMLVESEALWQQNQVGMASGFDVSAFNRFSHPGGLQKCLVHFPHHRLSEPFEVFRFDFTGWPPLEGESLIEVPIAADGTCHAVAYWFKTWLDEQTPLDTGLERPCSAWMQAIQVFSPFSVKQGRTLTLRARHSECNVLFDVQPSKPQTAEADA